MKELIQLQFEYQEILNQQNFIEKELDYSILSSHSSPSHQLSKVGNSGVTVFDLHKKEHVFVSYNFNQLFGYNLNHINNRGTEYFNERVHPEDLIELMKIGISMLKFFYQIPKEERFNYKLVSEYRILGKDKRYIRVIEQHQALELDGQGNLWLALAVIDVSPNQNNSERIKVQIHNFKEGVILPVVLNDKPELSKREIEILSLVKKGYLSKKISEKLFISIHTVNTHRQKILEKLDATNSMEAVAFASKLGLIK